MAKENGKSALEIEILFMPYHKIYLFLFRDDHEIENIVMVYWVSSEQDWKYPNEAILFKSLAQ